MELVYDIITTNNIDETDYKSIQCLSEINLLEKQTTLSQEQYHTLIEDQQTITLMENVLNNIFNLYDKSDLAQSILMAYYINGFYKVIFSLYMTRLDEKIVKYSHKIVEYMENLFSTKNIDIFELSLIDRFYSLYNLWISKNTIKTIIKVLIC